MPSCYRTASFCFSLFFTTIFGDNFTLENKTETDHKTDTVLFCVFGFFYHEQDESSCTQTETLAQSFMRDEIRRCLVEAVTVSVISDSRDGGISALAFSLSSEWHFVPLSRALNSRMNQSRPQKNGGSLGKWRFLGEERENRPQPISAHPRGHRATKGGEQPRRTDGGEEREARLSAPLPTGPPPPPLPSPAPICMPCA